MGFIRFISDVLRCYFNDPESHLKHFCIVKSLFFKCATYVLKPVLMWLAPYCSIPTCFKSYFIGLYIVWFTVTCLEFWLRVFSTKTRKTSLLLLLPLRLKASHTHICRLPQTELSDNITVLSLKSSWPPSLISEPAGGISGCTKAERWNGWTHWD